MTRQVQTVAGNGVVQPAPDISSRLSPSWNRKSSWRRTLGRREATHKSVRKRVLFTVSTRWEQAALIRSKKALTRWTLKLSQLDKKFSMCSSSTGAESSLLQTGQSQFGARRVRSQSFTPKVLNQTPSHSSNELQRCRTLRKKLNAWSRQLKPWEMRKLGIWL